MKKTITIVALSIIAALVITTIVLGFVNTNFAQINVSDAVSMTVYKEGKYNTYYKADNTKEYNDITNLYNKESKVSILTAIFTGAYSVDAKIDNENTTISNKVNSGTWVAYTFDKAQTLKLDGKAYVDTTSTSSDAVTFTKVYFQITKTDGMDLITAYICETTTATQAKYTMSIYANQTSLFNYIADLEIA